MGPGLAAHHKGAAPHPGTRRILTNHSQSACLALTTNLPGSNPMSFVLAIDQGTTSSRAIVFRSDISIAATAQQEVSAAFFRPRAGRA